MPHIASRGPGRPPAAKAADTRDRIILAACEIFGEVGYQAATFQAIAVRADLTRPAINHYFPSKQMLYHEAVRRSDTLITAARINRAREQSTLMARLETFVGVGLLAPAENPAMTTFLMTSALESQRHPELRLIEHDCVNAARDFLAWAINDAVETGELTTEADIPTLVETLVAMLWGIGFHAGFVEQDVLESIIGQWRQLLAGCLWKFTA